MNYGGAYGPGEREREDRGISSISQAPAQDRPEQQTPSSDESRPLYLDANIADPYMAPEKLLGFETMMAPVTQRASTFPRFVQGAAQKLKDFPVPGLGTVGVGILSALMDPRESQLRALEVASLPETTVDLETGRMSTQLGEDLTLNLGALGNYTVTGRQFPTRKEMEEAVGLEVMQKLGPLANLAIEDTEGYGARGFEDRPAPVAETPTPAPVLEETATHFQLQSGANYFTQMFGIDPKYLNYGLLPSELLAGRTPS